MGVGSLWTLFTPYPNCSVRRAARPALAVPVAPPEGGRVHRRARSARQVRAAPLSRTHRPAEDALQGAPHEESRCAHTYILIQWYTFWTLKVASTSLLASRSLFSRLCLCRVHSEEREGLAVECVEHADAAAQVRRSSVPVRRCAPNPRPLLCFSALARSSPRPMDDGLVQSCNEMPSGVSLHIHITEHGVDRGIEKSRGDARETGECRERWCLEQ